MRYAGQEALDVQAQLPHHTRDLAAREDEHERSNEEDEEEEEQRDKAKEEGGGGCVGEVRARCTAASLKKALGKREEDGVGDVGPVTQSLEELSKDMTAMTAVERNIAAAKSGYIYIHTIYVYIYI